MLVKGAPDVTTPQKVDFCAEFSPDLVGHFWKKNGFNMRCIFFSVPSGVSSAAIRGPLCQHPGGRTRVYPGPTYGHPWNVTSGKAGPATGPPWILTQWSADNQLELHRHASTTFPPTWDWRHILIYMLKSLPPDGHILTWLLIGWQLYCQPIGSHVGRVWLVGRSFNRESC